MKLHLCALLTAISPALTQSGAALQAPTIAEVDAVFAEYDTTDAPGMSVAVLRDGEFIHLRGYGLASLEHSIPNTPETIFRIGSTSKQFTAACIALLVLRGELDLDADIREFFPKMWRHDPPVTVRHLVHHTSGMRDYSDLIFLADGDFDDFITPEESIRALELQRGLAFEPGTDWQYSNSNYLLLGEIVHRVSGASLAEFAADHLFDPLGMEHSHFQDLATHVVRGRAWGYSPGEGGEFELDITILDHVGDGSVFTTVLDLARWDANFYDCALPEGEAFLELMLTEGLLDSGEGTGYGFGLDLDEYRGLRVVRHGGAWVGYRAELLRFPEQQLSIICLANRSDAEPWQLANEVADVLLADSFVEGSTDDDEQEPSREARPAEQPAPEYSLEDLQPLLGTFWSPELERNYEFVLHRDALALMVRGKPRRLKTLAGELTFRRAGLRFTFLRDPQGQVQGATMGNSRYGDFVLERR